MILARRFATLCLLVLALAGCKSTYSEKNVTAEPPPLLKGSNRIYVAIPFDASFKKAVAQGSGKATAESLFVALKRYARAIYLGKFPESANEALDSARAVKADYLIYPNIVKWEDRATEWSGRRDRLELKIDLLDLTDGKLVFSREISATGKWLTEGGDTPRDLLDQPVEECVNALFRRVENPSALW